MWSVEYEVERRHEDAMSARTCAAEAVNPTVVATFRTEVEDARVLSPLELQGLGPETTQQPRVVDGRQGSPTYESGVGLGVPMIEIHRDEVVQKYIREIAVREEAAEETIARLQMAASVVEAKLRSLRLESSQRNAHGRRGHHPRRAWDSFED